MKMLTATDISTMSRQQRLELLEMLWDSLTESAESLEIPAWHQQVLDERLAALKTTPEAGASWQEVKKNLFN